MRGNVIRYIRVRFKSVRLTNRVFRTRIIKIFTDVIALRKLSVQSVQSVFVLPTEFFSNTDYKDFHGYYCLAAMLT